LPSVSVTDEETAWYTRVRIILRRSDANVWN
jgi:hypothetical protein